MIPLSPRLLLAGVAVLALLGAVGGVYLHGRHAQAAVDKPKIEAAQDTAAVSSLEAQGARQTAQRVELVVTQRQAADKAVSAAQNAAQKAPDATTPLDPARAARLHASDGQLCLIAPELLGCAADRHAAGGDGPVQPVPPAASADPG